MWEFVSSGPQGLVRKETRDDEGLAVLGAHADLIRGDADRSTVYQIRDDHSTVLTSLRSYCFNDVTSKIEFDD